NTIGTVSSFDLLGVDPALPVTAVMHEPFFVPETKPLPELLATLQAERRHLALVVDEYGGFVGLVTVEDLVEEIVGEIEDEYDVRRELYRRVAPGVFVVSARAPVAELNERFGWNLPSGAYETVGGLVLDPLGRAPERRRKGGPEGIDLLRVPRMPRWLCQPRHAGRAWYYPFTLASGSDPRHESRVGLLAMDRKQLADLLSAVRAGDCSVDDALARL